MRISGAFFVAGRTRPPGFELEFFSDITFDFGAGRAPCLAFGLRLAVVGAILATFAFDGADFAGAAFGVGFAATFADGFATDLATAFDAGLAFETGFVAGFLADVTGFEAGFFGASRFAAGLAAEDFALACLAIGRATGFTAFFAPFLAAAFAFGAEAERLAGLAAFFVVFAMDQSKN